MIRSAARAATRQFADAVGSTRWTDTEVNQAMGDRQMYWWRRLLDDNPYYTFATANANTDANGQIPLSYTSGAGDAAVRSYRILGVLRDGIPLQEVRYSDYKTAATFGADLRAYYRQGTFIQILPKNTGTPIVITYNHVPVRADLLVSDASEVVFPVDFDSLYQIDAAAELLAKAGSETDATSYYKGLVAEKANDFLATYARVGTNPLGWRYSDDGLSWGSN